MIPLWDNIFKSDRQEKTLEIALKNNILFKDLNRKELELVRQIVNVRNYSSGEGVFQQGEVGVGMYIVLKGTVEIVTEDTKPGALHQPRFITKLGEGDFFGEIALVEETGRRTATATCGPDTVLIGFFKPDLFEVISRNPEAGVKILLGLGRVLGTRLAETTALLRQLKQKESES